MPVLRLRFVPLRLFPENERSCKESAPESPFRRKICMKPQPQRTGNLSAIEDCGSSCRQPAFGGAERSKPAGHRERGRTAA